MQPSTFGGGMRLALRNSWNFDGEIPLYVAASRRAPKEEKAIADRAVLYWLGARLLPRNIDIG
jgi:hypothetical protein